MDETEVISLSRNRRTTIADIFLQLNLPKTVRILDVACGTGIVAEWLAVGGYRNIDGLDPINGYLRVAYQKNLYRKTIKAYVQNDKEIQQIKNGEYDVIICSAGFFKGLIEPAGLLEFHRMVRKENGIIMWNVMEDDIAIKIDEIVESFTNQLIWQTCFQYKDASCCFGKFAQKIDNLVFTDCGSAYLSGYNPEGGSVGTGYVYIMKTIKNS